MNGYELLKNSKTFSGICFNGNYTMPLDHFLKILNHYEETGENLLDHYSECIYLSWQIKDECYFDHEEYNNKCESISKIRRLRLNCDFILDARICLNEGRRNYIKIQEKIRNIPRIEACKHTSKPEVRKAVFDLHGNECLKCGSKDNMTIDHVIPVEKGGENSIDNYQPLCKRCNSSKGIKIIDYRK